MLLRNGSDQYAIGNLVCETAKYLLFLCRREGSDKEFLLQVARTAIANGDLERMASILKDLKDISDELEAEFAKVKTNPNEVLNYHIGIPALRSTFRCKDHAVLKILLDDDYGDEGVRRINVLEFCSIKDLSQLVPLSNITEVDGKRLDYRTSAWVLGKALKTLTLACSGNVSVGVIDGTTILVAPDNHYVIIFDWTGAKTPTIPVAEEVRREEIASTVKAVIVVLGGDPETGYLPDSGDDATKPYEDYLWYLAKGLESNAFRAHRDFYAIVDSLWKRELYPFTTLPLEL